MYRTLINDHELVLKLKGMAPDGKIPRGLLLEGRPGIKDAIREFEIAKHNDFINEKRPQEEEEV
jgi:serine/threonine-protein phosphatase 2B catalytic subunit